MDIHTLIRSEKDSISIPELRKMLGIGKTESYWLIQNRGIKTFQLRGCMRVRNKDFWDWYDNQTKHRLLQGPPPGRALQETSYSVRELTQLLAAALLFYSFAFCPPALFSYSAFTAARPSKTS